MKQKRVTKDDIKKKLVEQLEINGTLSAELKLAEERVAELRVGRDDDHLKTASIINNLEKDLRISEASVLNFKSRLARSEDEGREYSDLQMRLSNSLEASEVLLEKVTRYEKVIDKLVS